MDLTINKVVLSLVLLCGIVSTSQAQNQGFSGYQNGVRPAAFTDLPVMPRPRPETIHCDSSCDASQNCQQCAPQQENIHVHLNREQLLQALGNQGISPEGRPSRNRGFLIPEDNRSGSFVAPKPSGAIQDQSAGYGIRGGSFTIPEIKISLPTFELPSLFRVRHQKKMRINETMAPFVADSEVSRQRQVGVQQQQMGYYGVPMQGYMPVQGYQQLAYQQQVTRNQQLQRNSQQRQNLGQENQNQQQPKINFESANAELEKRLKECEQLKADLLKQAHVLNEQKRIISEQLNRLSNSCGCNQQGCTKCFGVQNGNTKVFIHQGGR